MQKLGILMCVWLLGGCGEIHYKQGANGDEYARAQQECARQPGDAALCMEQKGWQKPALNLLDPLFATITRADQHRLSTANNADNTATPRAKTVVKTSPAQDKTTHAEHSDSKDRTESASIQAAETARSTVNDPPDTPYTINSWWKFGGFPEQLNRDQKACEQGLGDAYMPDYKTQTYKRLFLVCMHEKGWQAVRNPQ